MKAYIVYLFLFLTLSTFILFNNCKTITDTGKNEEEKIFSVVEINNLTIEEFIEITNSPTYPKEITLLNDSDFNYKGKVNFDSIGIKEIQNYYYQDPRNKRSFYIDTKGILGHVEYIAFSKIEIENQLMDGNYELAGPLIDSSPNFFKAIMEVR